MYRYVLFDLDGTLTASAEGIVNSIIYALNKAGIQENDREKLEGYVGPPLYETYMKHYGMTMKEAMHYVDVFREYYCDKGWRENSVYDGVPQMLRQLKESGRHLFLATSKPEDQALRIMDYFDLAQYFDFMGGASLDETRSGKSIVISYVREHMGDVDPGEIIMVGDRRQDVVGAAEHKFPCIGVLYGYGSREELENAGAAAICETALEIPAAIERLGNQ